jgi:predicted ATP-grasp superfamily ATP-dependent carboligase
MYDINLDSALNEPVLIAGFDGWVNAGDAATGSTRFLAGDGEPIVTFDSDQLFDYRDVRPTLRFLEGVPQGIDLPEVTIVHRNHEGRDLLVLSGPEPSIGWKKLCRAVVEISSKVGVVDHISLGGIPWAAPHTRPVSIITTASHADRLTGTAEHPEGLLTVPASATSAVEQAVISAGLPTIGFWARVPNYIGAAFHGASLALVERVSAHLGLALDTASLAAEAAEQRIQLDAIAQGRPEVKTIVERLEALVDDEPPVSGEQLASEIERFLRSQDEGGKRGDGFDG